MCLAIPVRITQILGESGALASAGGIVREIDITLVDDVQVGDYVILHVGFALSKLDENEAQQTLQTMAGIGATGGVAQ
jgi:hydrogenase expression/formation protein HypC